MFASQSAHVIRFFSANNPLNLFILLFLGILMKMPYFLEPQLPPLQEADGFLYKQFLQWLHQPGAVFPVIYPIIAYLLLFIQAVSLNSFVNEQKLFPNASFLTAFAYILITSLVPEWNTISPGLIINTIMAAVLPSMVHLYHHQKVKGVLFNIGFGFGICSFIYFPSVYLMLLLIIALALFRPVQITEWIVTIIGVLTPFYFLLVYFFVWDQWHRVNEIIPGHHLSFPAVQDPLKFWVLLGLLLVPPLVGFFMSNRYSVRLVVQGRKTWALILYYLLLAFVVPFINNQHNIHLFIITAIPLCIYTAALYTLPSGKRIPELFVWLGLAFIVWQYLL